MKALVGIVALTALIYGSVLSAPFVYEDGQWLIVLQPQGRNIEWSMFPSRMLTLQTYIWQADPVTGSAFPESFHAVNVGLHLITGILVWLLAQRLTGRTLAAGLAALIFLCHPLQTQAVAYISARPDLLMTLGATLAVLGVVIAGIGGWTLAIAGVVVAALSKEIGFLAAVLVILAAVWRGHYKTVVVMACLALVAAIPLAERLPGMFLSAPTWSVDVPLQLRGVARLLGLFVWPIGLSIDPDPVAWGLWQSLLGLSAIVAVLAAAWRYRLVVPVAACGVCWAVVVLLPRVLVPNGEPIHDHHAYFPMVGIAIATAAIMTHAQERVTDA